MEMLRKIIKEELSKVFEELETSDEAQISIALTFMQDLKSSIKSLESQAILKSTNFTTDEHLRKSIEHMKSAIKSYFESVDPNVKSKIVSRIGQIKI